jgi:hypothetical protein
VQKLNGDSSASFSAIDVAVPEHTLQKLRDFADEKYASAITINAEKADTEDLKLNITRADLQTLIGE